MMSNKHLWTQNFIVEPNREKPPTIFSLINCYFTKLFSSYNLMERLSPILVSYNWQGCYNTLFDQHQLIWMHPHPYFSATTEGSTYSLASFNFPSHIPSSRISLYNIFTVDFWQLIIHLNTYFVASSLGLIHEASYTSPVRFRPFHYDLFSPAPSFLPLFAGHVIYNFSLTMLLSQLFITNTQRHSHLQSFKFSFDSQTICLSVSPSACVVF